MIARMKKLNTLSPPILIVCSRSGKVNAAGFWGKGVVVGGMTVAVGGGGGCRVSPSSGVSVSVGVAVSIGV